MEILISEGKVIEIGYKVSDADQLLDCENKLITPNPAIPRLRMF